MAQARLEATAPAAEQERYQGLRRRELLQHAQLPTVQLPITDQTHIR